MSVVLLYYIILYCLNIFIALLYQATVISNHLVLCQTITLCTQSAWSPILTGTELFQKNNGEIPTHADCGKILQLYSNSCIQKMVLSYVHKVSCFIRDAYKGLENKSNVRKQSNANNYSGISIIIKNPSKRNSGQNHTIRATAELQRHVVFDLVKIELSCYQEKVLINEFSQNINLNWCLL